jgi:hypothetical protein
VTDVTSSFCFRLYDFLPSFPRPLPSFPYFSSAPCPTGRLTPLSSYLSPILLHAFYNDLMTFPTTRCLATKERFSYDTNTLSSEKHKFTSFLSPPPSSFLLSVNMANDGLRQRPVKEGSVVSPIAATETQAPKRVEPSAEARRADLAADTHHAYEFGGPIGVTAMMLGFPCLMCMSIFTTGSGETLESRS